MRSLICGGVLVCLGASALTSCSDAGPSTVAGPESPNPAVPISLAPGSGCNPVTHPSGTIIETMSAPSPWAVAVRDDGLAYFSDLFGNRVGITNTFTRSISGFIPTGAFPTGIAFAPDGLRAYSADQGSLSVSVIDVASAQVIATIPAGFSAPFSVQVSPDGSQLYVGNNDNTLLIVDTGTLQILKTLSVGFATNAFAVDPSGRMLYASHFVSGSVSEIDMFTGNVVRTFQLGGTTQGLALNRKGTHLYVANQDGYLNDVDLTTGASGPNVSLDGVAFGVGVTPDDNEAWITLPLNGKVQIYNLTQRRISGTLELGGEPRRIAFSRHGKIGALTDFAGSIFFVR